MRIDKSVILKLFASNRILFAEENIFHSLPDMLCVWRAARNVVVNFNNFIARVDPV
jgi:hypothetical protein